MQCLIFALRILNIFYYIYYRGEKKDKGSAVVIFYVNKKNGETKLTAGSASFGSNYIIVESSGYS